MYLQAQKHIINNRFVEEVNFSGFYVNFLPHTIVHAERKIHPGFSALPNPEILQILSD
jgi:hypothetical protein